jgi:ceramide glucosyltransferase
MHLIRPLMAVAGFATLGLAACYAIVALIAVLAWYVRRAKPKALPLPPVTVLKPLCGAEPGLYDNLRSFCRQAYPEFQVIFGVRDPADTALPIVRRLAAEFPAVSMDIIVNPRLHGSNLKVSNLINMLAHARHEVLVMADSDASVGAEYLAHVVAPLTDRQVGMVTSIYHGIPTAPLWSRLGAMYINEWYVPAVLIAWLFGHRGYASGQTLCLRRDTLEALGGFESIADQLAEDYRLGERVRALGLRIVLSRYLVDAEHHEPDLDSLARHELRWMRTTRVLRPRSFRWLFITFSLPLALVGILLSCAEGTSATAWILFGTTVAARLLLHLVHRLRSGRAVWSDLWLVPMRDALLCWIWCRSFSTSHVTWRGQEFDVGRDGVMRPLG